MRGRLAWLAGGLALAGAVAYRALTRRPPQQPLPAADPRADELRRKLAESRSVIGERDEFEAAETTVDEAEAAPPELDERRKRVHETGRAAARRMRDRPPE